MTTGEAKSSPAIFPFSFTLFIIFLNYIFKITSAERLKRTQVSNSKETTVSELPWCNFQLFHFPMMRKWLHSVETIFWMLNLGLFRGECNVVPFFFQMLGSLREPVASQSGDQLGNNWASTVCCVAKLGCWEGQVSSVHFQLTIFLTSDGYIWTSSILNQETFV